MIIGNPITMGGGASLNIDYGTAAPADTTKLWVPLPQKPSAVECSPVLQYGNEYVTAAVQTRPSTPNITSAAAVYYEGKIYLPASNSKMQIYDIATNTWETVTCSIVQDGGTANTYAVNALSTRGAGVIDGKIYYWGHVRGSGSVTMTKLYYDIATSTYHYDTSVLLGGDNPANTSQTIIAHGTRIYALGCFNGGNARSYAKYLDVSTNTGGSIADLPQAMTRFGVCSIGDAIYTVGGYWDSYSNTKSNAVYRYDVTTNSWTQDGTLPEVMYETTAVAYGQYIYIFCGKNHAGTAFNTIYRYDTVSKTTTTLGVGMPTSNQYAIAWREGSKIFMTGVNGLTDNRKQIDRFTVDTPLAQNNLFIQCDFGFDGLWAAINDKNTVIKVKAINAFLGDSSNLAQPTAAYLYNGANWVSLDGESMTADMLNALATLGVT